MQRHTHLQIAGWIFIGAGFPNVAASFLSKSPLFAIAGLCMFGAAIFFFVSAIKLKKGTGREKDKS
jgi:hypothetical protein